jgi:hypothetical protein
MVKSFQTKNITLHSVGNCLLISAIVVSCRIDGAVHSTHGMPLSHKTRIFLDAIGIRTDQKASLLTLTMDWKTSLNILGISCSASRGCGFHLNRRQNGEYGEKKLTFRHAICERDVSDDRSCRVMQKSHRKYSAHIGILTQL